MFNSQSEKIETEQSIVNNNHCEFEKYRKSGDETYSWGPGIRIDSASGNLKGVEAIFPTKQVILLDYLLTILQIYIVNLRDGKQKAYDNR